MNRVDHPRPAEDIFYDAMADLGRLLAAEPDLDRGELARRVLAICDGGGFGASGAIICHLSAASGLHRATEKGAWQKAQFLGIGRAADLIIQSGRFFEKKLRKKLLTSPAFERPQFGRSKAGENQKFFGYFFSKK